MTIDEFFAAIKAAKREDREKLVGQLLPQLSEDERILAGSTIGEFISALDVQQIEDERGLDGIRWE